MTKRLLMGCVLVALMLSAIVNGQSRAAALAALEQEPACQTLTPASMGGPLPKDPSIVVLRWLAHSNYELAYRDAVILLDAGFEAPPGRHPRGYVKEDITRATALLIGHAHTDHISDAGFVSQKTGAVVVSDIVGIELQKKFGLTDKLAKVVKGGETIEFKNVLVQVILGHHNVVPGEYAAKVREASEMLAYKGMPTFSEAEEKRRAAIGARGSSDPRIAKEGTLGYLLTLPGNFRIYYNDSPGPVTDAQRQVAQQIQNVDVGIFGFTIGEGGVEPVMNFVRLFKPAIFLPNHHEGWAGGWIDEPLTPLFHLIRNEFPQTKSIQPLYKSPICISTTTRQVYVGQ